MYPYLVADIGGTNARFALVTNKNNGEFRLEHIKILRTSEHPTLTAALHSYLEEVGEVRPTAMCVAVAGPVVGDRVRLTNLNWEFSCEIMAKEFNVSHFVAMNDFGAVAVACSQVTDNHLVTIKDGTDKPEANKAVFGAGTGLGVAGLIHNGGRWLPNPCEGGHVNLAPTNEWEADILKAAMNTLGYVSAEALVSGPGLVNLYRALCTVRGEPAEDLKPADITLGALEKTDECLVETLSTFCRLAGAFAGNLALTYGAKGGIYISGGVIPRFSDFLIASEFNLQFRTKGVMSYYVEDIPVKLIVHPETAFVGAAAWLEQHLHP